MSPPRRDNLLKIALSTKLSVRSSTAIVELIDACAQAVELEQYVRSEQLAIDSRVALRRARLCAPALFGVSRHALGGIDQLAACAPDSHASSAG